MKIGSILVVCVATAVGWLIAPHISSAQTAISFNLGGGSGTSGNAMTETDLAGAPGARVANWNSVTGMSDRGSVGTFPNGAIVDSKGASTKGLTATIVAGATGFGGNFSMGDQSTNDVQMFNGVFDQHDGTPTTISVTHIPYASYNVYFYVYDDGAARAGSVTVGSVTLYVRGGAKNPDATGAGYVRSTDTTGGGVGIQQGNYVEFTNLSGDLTASVQAVNAGDANAQRIKLAGFEIVQATAVPKPKATPTR